MRAFLPSELRKPFQVENDPYIIKEVAEVSKTNPERVKWVFKQFKEIFVLHCFLNYRKKNKLSLPETQEELNYYIQKGLRLPHIMKIQNQRDKLK